MPEAFRRIGKMDHVEAIAEGRRVRAQNGRKRKYGGQYWRKKGFVRVGLNNGSIIDAEIHWYEADGVGKVEWKIKYGFSQT